MTDERLIEEAAKAIQAADNDFDHKVVESPRLADELWLRAMARAALAVFEKAHTPTTPTDDEREALTKRFADLIFAHGLRAPDSTKAVIAFKEVAAGFRRSEVPEPSRIGCNLCGEALPDGEPHLCSEPQGEPSDDGHLITDCEHGVNSLYDRCTPCEAVEQGEPSDALPLWERPEAIEAARLAYQGACEADYDAEDCIEFALRAASEVRGEGR